MLHKVVEHTRTCTGVCVKLPRPGCCQHVWLNWCTTFSCLPPDAYEHVLEYILHRAQTNQMEYILHRAQTNQMHIDKQLFICCIAVAKCP